MRLALWLLAAAVCVLAESDEPWVEEEDVEEPYNSMPDPPERRRRDVFVEDPYHEHIRVKRGDEEVVYRVQRSAEYKRVPRQVHQYEVHEVTDEGSFPSPSFEEMLAASAEHYHQVYAAPGAPRTARYFAADGKLPALNANSLNGGSSLNPASVPGPIAQPYAVAPPPQNFAPVSYKVNQNSAAVTNPVQFLAPANLAPMPAADALAKVPVAGPVPVASEPVLQSVTKLAGGDLFGAAAGHHHHHHGHSHGHSAGGGHNKHGEHYGEHGGKTTKGFQSHHHSDKGGKGFKKDEHHRKEYEEAGGKKHKHHDQAGHKGGHEEEAHGHRGAHFDEKKGHKKGHKTKGYHNKYHKDEFHKEHKFYDDYHKSGEHHRFGKFHAKHASNESGKKKAHHVNAGHDFVERGKKGYSNKGHLDSDDKGYKGHHGHEEHHAHHSDHGKKGGSQGGKEWGYSKKA